MASALESFARRPRSPLALQAEAAFRAGELWRANDAAERALVCFRVARARGRGTPFRTRAMLEVGHLYRREESWSRALDAYFELSHDRAARAVEHDSALYWSGVGWSELGQLEAARRTWREVAAHAERPLLRVRAYDQWCRLEFNCGNLNRARDLLAACDAQMNAIASELTVLGASIRGALARMPSRHALAALEHDARASNAHGEHAEREL